MEEVALVPDPSAERETKRYITEAPFELPGDQEGWKREKDTAQEAVGKGSSRLTAKGGPDRTAIR